MTLIKELLTENRYWTFWSADWSKKVYIFWGGKTKFSNVVTAAQKIVGKDCVYERQIGLKEPELTFE